MNQIRGLDKLKDLRNSAPDQPEQVAELPLAERCKTLADGFPMASMGEVLGLIVEIAERTEILEKLCEQLRNELRRRT